jgi:hypothetical protein
MTSDLIFQVPRELSQLALDSLPAAIAQTGPSGIRRFLEFFTATIRGGSPPSQVLDLLGLRAGQGNAICYARIRLW